MAVKRKTKKVKSSNPLPQTEILGMKKPVLIAIVAIAALLLLSTLLFFSQQFVGRAYFENLGNTIGIVALSTSINPNTAFDVIVKANIGARETVALKFEMTIPNGLTCARVENLLTDWTEEKGAVLTKAVCADNKVTFEYGTLDWRLAKRGSFEIARISFNGAAAGNYPLNFASNSVEIIDFATGENVLNLNVLTDAEIRVEEAALQTMDGLKIKAEEIAKENNVYITKITAKEAINTPFQVITTLYDAENAKVVFEIRNIESMTPDENILIKTDSLGKTVKSKKVIIYDNFDPAVWTVHLNQPFTVEYP